VGRPPKSRQDDPWSASKKSQNPEFMPVTPGDPGKILLSKGLQAKS
jgi:hypothetical protein